MSKQNKNMTFFKKIIWVIFCLHPIFVGILYTLLLARFAKIELVDKFLTTNWIYLSPVVVAYTLIFIYLPANFLQLLLTLFLVFANRLKFSRNQFKILSGGLILLLVLTALWLVPYISITFFKNYEFSSLWHKQMYPLIYFLDIIVPLGQLFFIYIFLQFWKIWFGNEESSNT